MEPTHLGAQFGFLSFLTFGDVLFLTVWNLFRGHNSGAIAIPVCALSNLSLLCTGALWLKIIVIIGVCPLCKRYKCSTICLQHASSIWQICLALFVVPAQAIAVAFGFHSYGITCHRTVTSSRTQNLTICILHSKEIFQRHRQCPE